jgi:tRNA A-37 threonylcarbamoyl transferase component Bud32
MTRAPLALSKHFWIWPLLGAAIISLVGVWTRSLVEGTLKTELASRLQTLLNADIAALRLWFSEQESDVRSFAADIRIQQAILDLAALARDSAVSPADLLNSSAAKTLDLYLRPLLESQHYVDYVVVGPDRRVLASPYRFQVNRRVPRGYDAFVGRALGGQVAVSRPFAREGSPTQRAEEPTMFVAAPVKTTNGTIVAALGLRMRPEAEFSRIFSVARMGESGEAYAFDRRGYMLTPSRFDQDLKRIGLIPNTPAATAILNLQLLDPGFELTRSNHSTQPRSKLPLTRMAATATRGWDGYDVDGYRNYRGTMVIGAWAWLPEYGMGIATEAAVDEAFQTFYLLRHVFLTLFLLLSLSGIAIFAFSLLIERLQASVRRSALAARRLGQYVLVQEIGRGANGMVYRARHTLLRRPVAVKLLSPELTNEATAARFEHEVQMTSQLTHPNTVAIYDYGRTPEGLFYYAMEYLSGINLDRLVREFGPQPEGRVIHILRQLCGSLAEAHRIGLIHRDVKPANVVLTRRGGVCDLVKVLDFGMVKAVHLGPKGLAVDAVVGTPHFMSPEAIEQPESVDGRSDLFSVGAVGYWLLTGKTLFDTKDVDALLSRQANEEPPALSKRSGRPLSADLEQLIMRCLARRPEQRPPSAEALEQALAACVSAPAWTAAEAQTWWQANLAGLETAPVTTMEEKTLVIAPRG